MKRIPKAAVQKKKPTYAFYVTDVGFWKVVIFRYELVRRNEKTATVLDSTAKKKMLVLDDADGKVCDTVEEARSYAKKRIKGKKAFLKQYIKELDDSAGEIAARKVYPIEPKPFKI